MSSSFIPLTDANELPEREIQIRDAIKGVLENEPRLMRDFKIKKIHNTKMSQRAWQMPYLYVMFIGRTLGEHTDIANFEYVYHFDVGIVMQLHTRDEDKQENQLLKLLTLTESVLSVNKGLKANLPLFHYPHDVVRDDTGFTNDVIHMKMTINYTQDVPLGS